MSNYKHTCPECLRSFSFSTTKAGQAVNCPACKRPIRLPVPEDKPISTSKELLPQTDHTASKQEIKTTKETHTPVLSRLCPFCAEPIKVTALKCKHCGEFLDQENASTTRGSSNSGGLGLFMVVLGGIILVAALFMDTTVPSGFGRRVHNIGLQQQQMMVLLVGLAIGVIGAIITAVSRPAQHSRNVTIKTIRETKTYTPAILEVANTQKYLIWVILSQFYAIASILFQPLLGGLLILGITIFQASFIFRISKLVYKNKEGLFLAACSLAPIVGLAVLFIINGAATKTLMANGITVGYLGVPPSELRRMRAGG